MLLIAVWSSTALDLSIQQVSTQKYRRPSRLACSAQKLILLNPAFCCQSLGPLTRSAKTTSSDPHVWGRIAYGGTSLGARSSVRTNMPSSSRCSNRIVGPFALTVRRDATKVIDLASTIFRASLVSSFPFVCRLRLQPD